MHLASNQPSSDCAIYIDNLTYRYPSSSEPSLKDVNLRVPRGQCFGLLGPNGAGKTTLLSILTGMLSAQAGEVAINGWPLSQSAKIKKVSAIVPQDLAFYPGLTGQENLECFAGLHGLAGKAKCKAVAKVIGICQLEEVIHKRAESYSGGLKRRLNLAIGLLNEPQILYLDEPTVGIDAQSRNFILEAIRSLKTSGVTVIYTSHYMEEVQALCDEIAIVDHGQLVLQTRLADLLGEQGQVLDVRLQNVPSPEQLRQLTSLGEHQVRGRQLRLSLRSADITLLDVAELFARLQLRIAHMHYGMNRLEDIYLSITKHDLRD